MENICRVLCVCFFFQGIFPLHSSVVTFPYSTHTPLSFQEFCHLQRRDLFLKLFLNRMCAQCLGVSVCGAESLWSHPPFPYLLISPPHILCVIYAAVLCASEHSRSLVTVVFSGFNTHHKKCFGLG